MCYGRTSGTPPTSVVTTSSPQQAASKIAIQNDSVKLVFKKMCPLHRTSLTFSCGKPPRSSTLPCRLCLSTSSKRSAIPVPSPPMIKLTLVNWANIFGIMQSRRSTPFLYWSLDINTMFIWSGLPDFSISYSLINGFGVNFWESTAFGIVKV